MYIALNSHYPCKYCKYFKCHGAWEDHHIFDDRPPCLNKVHCHTLSYTTCLTTLSRHISQLQYYDSIVSIM